MKEYILGLYEKSMPESITWKEKFCAMREAGFDFLEMSIDETDEKLARLNWDAQQKKEFVNQMKDVGGKINSICLSGHRKYPIGSGISETEKKGMQIMEKAIDFAYDMGIRVIQLAGYDVYYDEVSDTSSQARFLENLYKSTLYAAKNEIILALETMENSFMNTINKAMFYVNEINSPFLQVYPDVGNVSNGTKDIIGDILSGKGHVVAAHLKETKAGVFRDLMYGEGEVDFKTIIKYLKKIGVRCFMAEFWWDKKPEWKQSLKYANSYLREYLEV